jgi:hypothetical protein
LAKIREGGSVETLPDYFFLNRNRNRNLNLGFPLRDEEGEITIKIKIKIMKEILNRLLPHPEGVTDGSRSVEAGRDLRIGVRRMIAPRRGASAPDELGSGWNLGSGTASGVRGICGVGSRGGAGPVSATPWQPSVNPPGSNGGP